MRRMEEKITFTEEQLAEVERLKQEAVAQALAEKEKEFSSTMAQNRISNEKKMKNAIDEAVRKATQTKEQEQEEHAKEQAERLAFLENEYKRTQLSKKLDEAQLPSMFVNDSRLLNATDEEVDEVIKTIKTEYSKLVPNGATINTNVNTGAKGSSKTEKEAKFESYRNNF